MKEISFPSFDIKFAEAMPGEIILMLLGGRKVPAKWLSRLDFYQSAWAIDSGIELCKAAKIIPERLIGDGDSADADAWEWAKLEGAKIYSYKREKDLTDFQLALELLSNEESPEPQGVILTGAFGGRFDHLISLFYSLTYWSDKYQPIGIADEREAVFLLRGGDKAEIKFRRRPSAISILPLEDSEGVSISGVRWVLEKVVLERAKPYSVSNRPDEGNVVVAEVEKGLIGLYCAWDEYNISDTRNS